ncbi:hypothetical protein J0K78_17005 [Halobacillus sp. GSS1]|uniref:hypothetical protein n=1 Tax=Halobacillus sp. GSS1 TaxID=2815919 RepID=UPI001A8E8012|nr:hypothetical protein [Halobacillus sp. GSS1]MBN9655977.1 hypothetical protein [Halobacillus sp. GSS1]
MSESREEVRERIEQMREKVRERRVKSGLPPESPDMEFVDGALARVLFESEIKPFIPVVTKYIASTIKAGRIFPVDTSFFEGSERTFAILKYSESDFYSGSIRGVIDIMKKNNSRLESGEDHDFQDIKKRLFNCGRFLKIFQKEGHIFYNILEEDGKTHDAKVKRFREDESLLNSEIQKVIEHYNSIEHLLEEMHKEEELKYENN